VKYVFSEWAMEELDEASMHYEKQSVGLGIEFLDEIDRAIQWIIAFPEASERIVKNVRLYQVKRFPYAIVYYVKDETVHVIAVMHQHRKPGYWKKRLKNLPRPANQSVRREEAPESMQPRSV
jgi:plasmid stabilization system protein ParE